MNKEMAETLVRTGPGTPMGNLMRRYWVPILLASEVAEPDGPPVRAHILGEKLLAFRNSDGKVGLVDEFCSHRGASLYFGRNEENGIRCAYHGLKFAIDGQCVDVPSAPQACKHMGIKAYPCIERAGMVWAYMGPKGKEPAPPPSSGAICRPATSSSRNASRSAILSRPWKAVSTPATCLTCTASRWTRTRCTRAPRRTSILRPTAT